MRWLVGGLLAAVLVVGLVFAVSNLGSLFRSTPQSEAGATTSPDVTASSPATATEQGSPSATPTPAGPPVVDTVTRLGNFDFAATYDGDLAKTIDGNGASYWSDMEFATDNWGGLASEVPLVVKLEKESKVSSVTLEPARRFRRKYQRLHQYQALPRRCQAGRQQQLHLAGPENSAPGTGQWPSM